MRLKLATGTSFALIALLAAAGPAGARAKPTLVVTSLVSHHGARIGPAERFRVTGVVRNRGRAATPALVSAALRRNGKTAFALGGRNLRPVPAGRSRRFTVAATGPLLPAGSASRRYTLYACVRPRRGARGSCRHLRRTVLVVAPGKGSGTGSGTGTGSGGPGGTGGTAPGGGPVTGTAPDGHPFTPGARSAGDRLFPAIGNGGYDATHYDLAIAYDPSTKRLSGTATIDARATQDLSQFSLDLHGLPVSSVLIDGAQATFSQEADKLVVNPAAGIPDAAPFTVTVAYASPVIASYTDPDGSSEGWVATSDGAFVVNEPVGSMSWFPNDNVPTDKATYDLNITVPTGSTVFGNGRLVDTVPAGEGKATWHWREDEPTASYLVTATNGAFVTKQDTTTNPDVPAYYGLDSSYTPAQQAAMQGRLDQTPSILGFYAGFLSTPYPFSAAGGVVDKSSVGYALETQTKPMYAVSSSIDPASPGLDTISHELAHQWFGDDVSPATWSDIWLNEGPAEFFSWLWQERSGTSPLSTSRRFDLAYANATMNWSIPPAAPPTAADMFDSDAMYTRGAMVMEALRQILGEDRFKAVLADYLAAHRYANASTQQFVDLVKAEGGRDPARLDAFFRQWLYGDSKPTITPSNF